MVRPQREAVVDIVVVAKPLPRPDAVHGLARGAHARDCIACNASIALRIGPRQQRMRKLARSAGWFPRILRSVGPIPK
jgi:hypothetical protein